MVILGSYASKTYLNQGLQMVELHIQVAYEKPFQTSTIELFVNVFAKRPSMDACQALNMHRNSIQSEILVLVTNSIQRETFGNICFYDFFVIL